MAFDPGLKTGFASFAADGEDLDFDNIAGGFLGFLKWSKRVEVLPEVVIIEDYFIRPQTAMLNVGRGETIRVLGAIQFWAMEREIETVLQDPAIQSAAANHFGLQDPNTNHDKWHFKSAQRHGYHYLHELGLKMNILEAEKAERLAKKSAMS